MILPSWQDPAGHPKAADVARAAVLGQPVHLLSLLLAGLTDDAIAAQLAISRRTVQRRLRALIDTAGVRTRTELVWYASRQNWV